MSSAAAQSRDGSRGGSEGGWAAVPSLSSRPPRRRRPLAAGSAADGEGSEEEGVGSVEAAAALEEDEGAWALGVVTGEGMAEEGEGLAAATVVMAVEVTGVASGVEEEIVGTAAAVVVTVEASTVGHLVEGDTAKIEATAEHQASSVSLTALREEGTTSGRGIEAIRDGQEMGRDAASARTAKVKYVLACQQYCITVGIGRWLVPPRPPHASTDGHRSASAIRATTDGGYCRSTL